MFKSSFESAAGSVKIRVVADMVEVRSTLVEQDLEQLCRQSLFAPVRSKPLEYLCEQFALILQMYSHKGVPKVQPHLPLYRPKDKCCAAAYYNPYRC